MNDEENSSFDDIVASQQASEEPPPPREHGRRRAGGPRKRKRSGAHLLPVLLVLVVVLAVGGAGVYGHTWVTDNLSVGSSEPDDYEGTGNDEVVLVEVADGETGSEIAQTLVENEVIKSPEPFVSLFSTSPDAGQISAGTYQLKKQMSSRSALDALLDPESISGVRVTIPEGMRMSKIFETLAEETHLDVEDFEEAAENYTDHGIPENPADSPEGYLWPGRYDIPEEATAGDVLEMMYHRMESELDARGVAPEDRHQVLTEASIAEKEARTPEDYGKVIRTIDNRLEGTGDANGDPMKLQLDSTVAYISGKEEVSTTPKERKADSPYNTYKYEGLPVGPIANPGAETIDAALDPPDGDWLYWVTVNTETGETKFAETKKEHDANVEQWQKWARDRDS